MPKSCPEPRALLPTGPGECGVSTRLDTPIDDALVYEPSSTVQRYEYKDFRQWRAKNHRGGDFMVLSNVRRVQLAFPLKFQW